MLPTRDWIGSKAPVHSEESIVDIVGKGVGEEMTEETEEQEGREKTGFKAKYGEPKNVKESEGKRESDEEGK
jgi:hypothetical protein